MSPAGEVTDRQVWSVSQFVGMSRDLLMEAMPFVWVRGEISKFSVPASGHWYFDLKDQQSVVPVAMFGGDNRQVPFDVEAGMELIVGGEVTIYQARGKFQIVAKILEPVGWGALQLAYEQLKARLSDEGLFDPARKRPLPLLPGCVGVVTSPTGAAWHDMVRVWQKNDVPIRAVLSPARVQGDGAAQDIVAAIERLNKQGAAEVIIVGRGGGSREDLWAFNEETVARAIADSSIPIVSAVGHEIDQTIADLVADQRAATPTAAAELVASSRAALGARLEAAQRRGAAALSQRLLRARTRLQASSLQRHMRQPSRLLQVYRQRLDESFSAVSARLDHRIGRSRRTLHDAARLLTSRSPTTLTLRRRARVDGAVRLAQASMLRRLAERQARLTAAVARVEALSPLAVLGRGYAICERRADRLIVRRADDVEVGDGISILLEEDTLDCTVDAARKGTTPSGL